MSTTALDRATRGATEESAGNRGSVLVVGAGLAGLAATQALAARGYRVTLLEARPRLGGRAGSFTDGATGQMVDACQHVSMGCCTNFEHFCREFGVAHLLEAQPRLYFMTPEGRVSPFGADRLPAPVHLFRSFLAAHYLTWSEKLRVAWGLLRLERTSAEVDPPFADWLTRNGQTARTVDRFWGLVLTSALNETPERIGLRYARKVFVDGFLRHRRGFEVQLPTVPLGRLYGEELLAWLENHRVQVLTGTAVRRILVRGAAVDGLETRSGEVLTADWYLSTVPFDRLLDLLPPPVVEEHSCFGNLRNLETSPITSVHRWYTRPVTPLPHVVLVDCVGQWVFNRGEVRPGEHYVQVVVSAARQFRNLGHEEIERRIGDELSRLFPAARPEALLRSRVVTERAATFSVVPGVDAWRPSQTTPLDNFLVAGDWTATGWPATMEGAVRSGYLAAGAMVERAGGVASFLRPDLTA
jgi:squalene-associated FAD-dependent desaturase